MKVLPRPRSSSITRPGWRASTGLTRASATPLAETYHARGYWPWPRPCTPSCGPGRENGWRAIDGLSMHPRLWVTEMGYCCVTRLTGKLRCWSRFVGIPQNLSPFPLSPFSAQSNSIKHKTVLSLWRIGLEYLRRSASDYPAPYSPRWSYCYVTRFTGKPNHWSRCGDSSVSDPIDSADSSGSPPIIFLRAS